MGERTDRRSAEHDESLETLVEAEAIAAIYSKALAPGVAILVNAALIVWVVWDALDHTALLGWYGAHVALTIVRGLLVAAYHRAQPAPRDAPRWGAYFAVGSFSSGVLWGLAGVLLLDASNPALQVFVVFVLAGMAAGSATSHSSYLPAYLAYLVPSLVPAVARFAVEGDRLHVAMAFMVLLYIVFVTMIARIGARAFHEASRLRFENATLAAQLAKSSEQALARFRALFDEAGASILVARNADLQIVDANAGAARYLRVGRASILGKRLDELEAIVDVFPDFRSALALARERGHAATQGTEQHPERGPRQLELNLVLRAFEGEEFLLGVGRDVTEQKNLEAQLVRSNLLASVGSLAAGVAHEINNPLAYVSANLSFVLSELERAGAGSAELASALSESIEGATRIRAIVRDMTPLARGEAMKLEPVDTRQVIESCLNIASKEIRHRAELVLELGDVPPVIADAGRLAQVVLNLLVNAGQAIEEGDIAANRVIVRTRREGDRVHIEIEDTGCGIPEELRKRIFDPFFTTKPVGSGTGLGLAICERITEDMGGQILLESEVGRGTTFSVVLPASEAPSRASPPHSAPSVTTLAHRPSVLVIDDEEHVARSLRRVLRAFDVTIADNGHDGLEKVRSGTFDAVICDLMMPDLTGMEIYDAVAREMPGHERSMVFMTGGAVTDAARDFLGRIDNVYIHKPFDTADLHERLTSLVATRRRVG